MSHLFEPFTPDEFKKATGYEASHNEAIYMRWVNTQINYATYLSMNEMNTSLKEVILLLKKNGIHSGVEASA